MIKYKIAYRLVVVCAVILMRATAQSRQKVICVSYVYSNYSETPPAHTSTYPKELELWTVNRIIGFPVVVPFHFPATTKGKGGGGTLEGKNENSSPKSLQTNQILFIFSFLTGKRIPIVLLVKIRSHNRRRGFSCWMSSNGVRYFVGKPY